MIRNQIIEIEQEKCESLAQKIFYADSGIKGDNPKFEKMRKRAVEMRDVVDPRVNIRAVYSYDEDLKFNGEEIEVGGVSFTCPAFQMIKPETIKGAYTYFVTSGDYAMEDEVIMDQLLADIWGTAFVDAGRIYLLKIFEEECKLGDRFGPGFYGMDVRSVHGISNLCDNSLIDVEVRENGIMLPVKSCAGMIFSVTEDYVPLRDECRHCVSKGKNCNMCNINRG